MKQEEFENIKRKIKKRAELELFYINSEIEKFKNFGLRPDLPINSLNSSILDYMAYGTDRAKENVLFNIKKLFMVMTQEDKDLLLKDLCARLPYGVKVKHEAQDFPSTLLWVDSERLTAGIKADKIGVGSDWGNIEFIKPFLRPMSSMTKEERKIYAKLLFADLGGVLEDYYKSLDYLNSIHIDYRGLIPKGLAIEVTEENNPY